ncbi:hypothetical protein D3C81_1182860 [compost metagenome]
MQLQRTVIGIDRVIQTALTRQRVAEVVPTLIRIDAFEPLLRSGEIALPIRINAFAQPLMLKLVRTLPPPALLGGGSRLHHRQQCAQCEQRQYPARATESEQGQQQQRQHQPIAFVLPGFALLALLPAAGLRPWLQHVQRLQIGIGAGDALIAATTSNCQCAQRCLVQVRMLDATARIAIRSALQGAQTQYRHLMPGRTQLRCGSHGGSIGVIGQQQHVAIARTGLLQQISRPGQCAVGLLSIQRHDFRRQRIQKQRDIGRVIGQRRHGEGFPRIGNQCHFAALAFAQQGGELGPHLQQPRWRQIRGANAAGKVEHDHQRRLGFPQRLLHLPPTRPGQCKHCQQQAQRQRHTPPPAALAGASEQV